MCPRQVASSVPVAASHSARRPILAARGEPRAVRAEGESPDGVAVAVANGRLLPGSRVKHRDAAFGCRPSDTPAVCRPGSRRRVRATSSFSGVATRQSTCPASSSRSKAVFADPRGDPKAAAGLGDADMTPVFGADRHGPVLAALQVRDAQAGAGQDPNPEPIRGGDQEALPPAGNGTTAELSSSRLCRCRHSQPRRPPAPPRGGGPRRPRRGSAAPRRRRPGRPGRPGSRRPASRSFAVAGVLLGLAALAGLGDGKEDRADQPQDQGRHGGRPRRPPAPCAAERTCAAGTAPTAAAPGSASCASAAPDVRRQVRRRRIAPRRVLLQRLGHDGLHVAAAAPGRSSPAAAVPPPGSPGPPRPAAGSRAGTAGGGPPARRGSRPGRTRRARRSRAAGSAATCSGLM